MHTYSHNTAHMAHSPISKDGRDSLGCVCAMLSSIIAFCLALPVCAIIAGALSLRVNPFVVGLLAAPTTYIIARVSGRGRALAAFSATAVSGVAAPLSLLCIPTDSSLLGAYTVACAAEVVILIVAAVMWWITRTSGGEYDEDSQ